MSTSDAGESELTLVGGETQTRLNRTGPAARSTAAREQQDETFGKSVKQEIHPVGATPAGQHSHSSAIKQEETHKAPLRADRLGNGEGAHGDHSNVQSQNPFEPRFTSCLFFRVSRSLGLHNQELRLQKNLKSRLHSSTEAQRSETENNSHQVHGQTSPPDTVKETSDSQISKRILSKKKEDITTVICNELEITKDLSVTHNFSHGEFGPHEHNDLCILSHVSQPSTATKSVELEVDKKDCTQLERQADLVKLSNPTKTMLSSTVVTVLAPHWSGRLRRTKRFEGTGNSEAQGNLQDVTSPVANHTRQHPQETMSRSLTDTSQMQSRVPFLGTRRNTVGWSASSGPVSLDYESKRKMIQTVSLDVNSGRKDNRPTDTSALSPGAATSSFMSPLSLEPKEQRGNSQTGHQGGLSSLSSKPTTSTLLLSLRRFNSSGKNSNAPPTLNHSSLSSSPSNHDGKFFTTHLSQTFHNNNEQERPVSLLSPSSISHRTTETGPVLSPSPSNHGERNTSQTCFFSASPTHKDTENTPFTQQHQTTNRPQTSILSSKQAYVRRSPSEMQQNCRGADKTMDMLSKSSVSSSRHSPYDPSALLNTHSQPRRTTLTSTSWWKEMAQDGSSPPTLNDARGINDKPPSPLVTPSNDKSDMSYPTPPDYKNSYSQISQNRNNNNTTEIICKGNMNITMNTQGGTSNLQKNAERSPDHVLDRLVKQQYVSSSSNREPQKPHSLPDVLSTSKSRAAVPIHAKDLTKHDENNISFAADVNELSSTLLNPKSPNRPTENSSKYSNLTSKINSNPTSSYNSDPQKFAKPPFSLANTLSSQALTSETVSGPSLSPDTKTMSSFHSHPVASQKSIHVSSYTSASQTPKITNTASATPLGFERSYASIPKPFHSKSMSSLVTSVSAFSKTNYSPVPMASTTSSPGSHPAALTGPSLLPSFTPVHVSSPTTTATSSLLTPPPTPIITSPNYSDSSSPKEGRTFIQEKDTKKKRVRRVTWQDSVDLPRSENITVEKADQTEIPGSSPPSRSPRSIKAPSIFSFLRSSSPATNTSPLCAPTPKTTSIQVGKGGKYRSLSSDSADIASRERERSKQRARETVILDQGRRDLTTPRQERTLSVESGTAQCRSSAPLSLPPDFSSGYKLRYSSPPYSTLISTRSTQGETKMLTPRSPLFQQPSLSNYTHASTRTDTLAPMSLLTSKPPLSPVSPPLPLSLPPQNKTATRESSKCGFSETGQMNNYQSKNNSQNGQILLVDNRVHVSSQSLQGDKAHNSPSFVTETLVYTLKSKVDRAPAGPKSTTPKPVQHTANTPVSVETRLSQHSQTVQCKGATGEPCSYSDQSSSGSSTAGSQPPDDESSNKRVKENTLGKSRFFSVECNNEQSPKRIRFALKKSISTPNSSLSRAESDRASKTNNKMDQVLNRLKQTFSTKRSDDDMLFPWKWKRAPQTPSISGSSDISNVSDNTAESHKTLDKPEQEDGVMLKDKEEGAEITDRWTQNRYTLSQASASGAVWLDTARKDQDEQTTCTELMSESKNPPHLTIHSPATHQFDFCQDNRGDYNTTNQFLSCRDLSPGRSPNQSAAYSAQFGKSTPSPRSPFSPFSSLSPLSPFPSPDVTDDSVFYSPKLQRRKEPSSPCEPGEGVSLGVSRRSRASTGPPSVSPGQGSKECLTSSYADLKYGIEPGRSFSVSSVLSSRPSGPGRISTGSRFMSVGDLSEPALTSRATGKDLSHWSITPDWTMESNSQSNKDCRTSYFPSDPGKMRSRSLPRSLTRCLTNWSSEVSASPPVNAASSKTGRLWSPNMNTCHFAWDTDGPPTPPPTPPLSPVSRRISKPPSHSSPNFPSSPAASQQLDNQSSKGHLPSRGYVSSLSTFEESSDSSSDTTTDDEYYLETGEDGEKETEL